MIQAYRTKKEIPRHFIKLLPIQCPPIQAGEICRCSNRMDICLFDAREGYVPWIEREYIVMWNELFEPITEAECLFKNS